jgi:hypothetical protein
MIDKKAIDEMFEPFFTVLSPLIKDPALGQIFYRTFILLAKRSETLRKSCKSFLEPVPEMEEDHPKKLGHLLLEEITEM